MKILIIDDSPTNAYLCKLTLEKLGHEVDLAANGRQGLEKLAQHPFDCVFTDIQMPEMKGPELAKAIRSEKTQALNPKIYIIGMSGNTSDEDKQLCLGSGMNDFIEKPLDNQKFSEAIARYESLSA